MRWLLNRWWRWAAGLFCLSVLGMVCLFYVGVFSWRHHPTMEEFYRIEPGMTPAQVEAILGPPHKMLTADSGDATPEQKSLKPDPDGPVQKVYYYEGAMKDSGRDMEFFVVEIGLAGKVRACSYGNHTYARYFWRLRRWLGKAFGG